MDDQKVVEYGSIVVSRKISMVVFSYLVLVVFVIALVEHFHVLIHLKCYLQLNCELYGVSIILLNKS